MRLWLVSQIQLSDELTTKLAVNKLLNRENREEAVVKDHTSTMGVSRKKISSLLRIFSIISSTEPTYHVVIKVAYEGDNSSPNSTSINRGSPASKKT